MEGFQKHLAIIHSLLTSYAARTIPGRWSQPDTARVVKGSGNKSKKHKGFRPLPHARWLLQAPECQFSTRAEMTGNPSNDDDDDDDRWEC